MTPSDLNSYGARRGNFAVMARGTFSNVKLENKMIPKPGPYTMYYPSYVGLLVMRSVCGGRTSCLLSSVCWPALLRSDSLSLSSLLSCPSRAVLRSHAG